MCCAQYRVHMRKLACSKSQSCLCRIDESAGFIMHVFFFILKQAASRILILFFCLKLLISNNSIHCFLIELPCIANVNAME